MSLTKEERYLRVLRRWYQVYNFLRCAAFFIRMKELTQITRRDMTEQFGKKNILLIQPNGSFKICWNSVLLLFISFTVVWMPFYMAYFGDELEDQPVIVASNWAVDVVFFVDLFVSLLTAYHLPSGVMQNRLGPTLKHNFDPMFIMDIIASFPISALLYILDLQQS